MSPGKQAMPLGISYVLERWRELTDPNARWWTQGSGLGIRLRIEELLRLSEAHQGGLIYAGSVNQLRGQAKEHLGKARSFIGQRYEPLQELLNEALQAKTSERSGLATLWPGSGSHASLKAGLRFLEGIDYLQALTDELNKRAGASNDISGLEELDEIVELLDAELVGDGHSRRWRREFYERVSKEVENGTSLDEAVVDELGEKREVREFEVVAGVERYSEPTNPEAQPPYAEEEVLLQLISAWDAEPEADDLDLPLGAFVRPVKAADRYAAVETAAETFGNWKAVWSLQGGEIELRDRFIVYDAATKSAATLDISESLNLRPENLDGFAMRDEEGQNGTPQELTDGLLQLAQARRSPRGAVLADLWGVAEVCFSGVAVGSRDQAGGVIAGITQFLYLTDRLEELGERLEAIGVEPKRGVEQTHADWVLGLLDADDGHTVVERLKSSDPLVWARAKQVARWKDDKHLQRELLDVKTRVAAVCARAYLIRNFHIHAGSAERSAALAVTLPVFAELLRLSLGFGLQSSEPVVSARLAMLRARQLAFEFKEAETGDLKAVAKATDVDWGT